MTTKALAQPMFSLAPLGSLDAYIQRVHQAPILSLESEQALANQFKQSGDLEAARSLVVAHLRFVVKVARGYLNYGLPLADLIQEGNIGLMKAVKRFDASMGVRLVSFAIHWIKAEIQEFILRNWRLVKIATTKAQRKLFFNLRSIQKKLAWFSPSEATAVAQDLNVSTKDVFDMEARLATPELALESTSTEENEESAVYAPIDYLVDESQDPAQLVADHNEAQDTTGRLQAALHHLDERSQDIIQCRWLSEKKTTLNVLAKRYSISLERVRQLEMAALKQLRATLNPAAV